MSVEVGMKVYVEAHAYHHYLGEVSEVLGIRRIALINASKVISCRRGWEDFFAQGCQNDTTTQYVGTVLDCGYIDVIAWNHDLPRPKRT
jgi:hypothetical protein